MISHDHQCIFVHIPKTAGNSINRVFGVGWEDHQDLQRYFDELPRDVFERYFKFVIVRNPWDRLLSDYNYQLKKSRAPSSKLFVFTPDGSKRNFAEWVETALSAPDQYEPGTWGGNVSAHIHRWSPQVDWISVGGQSRVDFVARIERLPEDFRAVCRRLALPTTRLPHRNRRLHWHYSHYYDRSTRELVAAYYARDIAQFDYEFEPAFLRLAVNWPGARRATESASNARDEERFSERLADDATSGCTVSFATARPPTRRRIWQRHPVLSAAAGIALALGTLGWSSPATVASAEDSAAWQSVRQIVVNSTATPPARVRDGFWVRAHRFRRAMAELKLSLELQPASTPGGLVSFVPASDEEPRDFLRATAPAITRSGAGPAPRWWVRRNRTPFED